MSTKLPAAFDAYLQNLESLTNQVRIELTEKKQLTKESKVVKRAPSYKSKKSLNLSSDKTHPIKKMSLFVHSDKSLTKVKDFQQTEISRIEKELEGVLIELDIFRNKRKKLMKNLSR